jgi:hypothetical protein
VRLLRHCFLDEAADVRQTGVGSARAARLDRRRGRIQANDAHTLVRLNAGGGHRKKGSYFMLPQWRKEKKKKRKRKEKKRKEKKRKEKKRKEKKRNEKVGDEMET